MLPVAESQDVDVVHSNGTARWRNVPDRNEMQDPVVRSGECALLDGKVVDEVTGSDIEVRVGEGAEGEPSAGSGGRTAECLHALELGR